MNSPPLPRRICVDARLVSGVSGGVEQAIVGLAHGLSRLADGDEEYLFLTYAGSDDWLAPHLRGPCRTLSGPPAPPPAGSRLPRPLARSARALWHQFSPALGPRTVPIPHSDGTAEGAGAALVHFTTQTGFRTALPTLFQPWDLQHLHLPQLFTPRERYARERLYPTFCRQAALVVAATAWVKQDLIRHYRLPPERIAVVPAAPLPSDSGDPNPAELAAVRRAYRLPEAFIYYPAQTWPHKNHLALLEALARLRDQEGLAVPLVCSGTRNQHHFPAIARRLRALQLESQVHFLGYLPGQTVQCLYRLCRCVVYPTLFEGLGLPLLEAFAAGTAVACADVTCLPEQAGDAALLFDPHRPASIGAAIRRLWDDEELRQSLIDRGRRRVQGVSWLQTARVFRALYRRCAGWPLDSADRELVERALGAQPAETGP